MRVLIFTISFLFFSLFAFSASQGQNDFAKDEQTSYDIKVFPNPCSTNIITIQSDSYNVTEIVLSNIAGQKVLTKEYAFPEKEVKLQLSDFPNGIYLVRLKTSENKFLVKKIIISRK